MMISWYLCVPCSLYKALLLFHQVGTLVVEVSMTGLCLELIYGPGSGCVRGT